MSALDSLAASLFAATSPLNPHAPHLKPLDTAIGSPPPAPLPPPRMAATNNPLCLSIDAGVATYKACVLDEKLRVVWTAAVDIDDELQEYGTRDGVHTLGDVVTTPSELRLHALDLLLEKLTRDSPDPTLVSRIACISGAGQPNTLHYLSHSFPTLLSSLQHSPQSRISSILSSQTAFALSSPATSGDTSASSQVRALEMHFGKLAIAQVLAEEGEEDHKPLAKGVVLEDGRDELVRRTGEKVASRSPISQLLKVVQEKGEENEGVLDRTGRIVLESGLLASIFLGELAPADAADACSTNLFNPVLGDWDDDILDFVMAGGENNATKIGKMRNLLGEVEKDGGIELGRVAPYFVQRFGFSPNCIVAPFTGSEPATFLSFPLASTSPPRTASHDCPPRDALVSLSSIAESDVLLVPCEQYVPAAERAIACHPAKAWWENPLAEGTKGQKEGEIDGTPEFIAIISSRDAGVGRALSRDLYCNGQWDVFSHLSAIVPHGGTIGLDEKYYAFFFPHGEATSAQGFIRFVAGAKVQEFTDRKINPRLLLESQFMSLRLRLGRLYRALLSPDDPRLAKTRPFDACGFPAFSSAFLPSRIVLVGDAAQNPAMSSLVSTIFDTPAFLPLASGLKSMATGQKGGLAHEEERDVLGGRKKTSAAALGAGYKAAWAFSRSAKGDRTPFREFLNAAIEAHSAEDTASHVNHKVEYEGRSATGTFASSSFATGSSASAPPPTILSLGSQSTPRTSHAAGETLEHEQTYRFDAQTSREWEENDKGRDLEPDPPGLTLVAMPDKDEWKYYSSMLPEFVRLERSALKGLV
ncbi:xylulokinase [Rhodotorula toruloides]|uniref:Xylulokinase n=1 Tax=Rhodotorula toruloides TaxID=5286 RepID=A0A511K9E4_RHOTO|nr:xylulokinase [Rhodotorula toruloides]